MGITNQKLIIKDCVERLKGHFSVQELHHAASRKLPRLSLATTYRILKGLEAEGFVQRAGLGEPAIYELASPSHSHLMCMGCGKLFNIPLSGLPKSIHADLARKGFKVDLIEILVKGLCRGCRRKAK